MSRLELLGQNIKKYRNKIGMSQEVLAGFVGLSREYILRIEKGQKYVSLKKIFEIADILKVNIKDLMDFE